MKKIVLFAASMMLCAGLAFAQSPQKTAAKAEKATTTQTVKEPAAETPATKGHAAKGPAIKGPAIKGTINPEAKSCGNCPHHKQCDKSKAAPTDAKATPNAIKKDESKEAQKTRTTK